MALWLYDFWGYEMSFCGSKDIILRVKRYPYMALGCKIFSVKVCHFEGPKSIFADLKLSFYCPYVGIRLSGFQRRHLGI